MCNDTPIKRCSKCEIEKPITEFSKYKRGKDGLQSSCKSCMAEYHAEYYRANQERIAEYRRLNQDHITEYRHTNRERIAKYAAEYHRANKERVAEHRAEYMAEYRRTNRERILAQRAEYRRINKEYIAEYYLKNKKRMAEYKAQYRRVNKDKVRIYNHTRRAHIRRAEGTHTPADMREQFTRQKGICYYCDCKLIHPFAPKPKATVKRVAHWEHIIPLARGGRNSLDNLVWACANCNLSKNSKLLGIEWKAPNGRLL